MQASQHLGKHAEDSTFDSIVSDLAAFSRELTVEVDFASPNGGRVVYDQYSDPHFEKSMEPEDLVSKDFLAHRKAVAKLETTLKLSEVDLSAYDAIHVAGGRGATFDLYPNEDVARALEYFWAKDKVVGAICHGAVAPR